MKKKPELRQLRQLRITEAIFLKKNLNYVNYVITPITQLQKRQNHPLVLPLVQFLMAIFDDIINYMNTGPIQCTKRHTPPPTPTFTI